MPDENNHCKNISCSVLLNSRQALQRQHTENLKIGNKGAEIRSMPLFTGKKKKEYVHDKFSAVSAKYDLLNSLLSGYVDHYWRWQAARELAAYPQGPVLDLCAGTLPLSVEVARQIPRPVIAVDFCYDMLAFGRNSISSGNEAPAIWPVCGDGEGLPFPDATFQGITVAFGVRNLGNLEKGLSEMRRVLMSGGKLVVLEFSRPSNPVFAPLYRWYLHNILPVIGGMISGDRDAYQYLAESIEAFPAPEQVAALMDKTGYRQIRYRPMTMGVVTLYTGLAS
jgi:demethylmenaquinone methyltransferase/2-methoxy-6-polyprenyl-1,4-benzoquinol methylase